MMNNLKLDVTKCQQFVAKHELEYLKPLAKLANDMVNNKAGAGNEFMGWVDLPLNYDKEEFDRILKCAKNSSGFRRISCCGYRRVIFRSESCNRCS